jgi:hypothetical protein
MFAVTQGCSVRTLGGWVLATILLHPSLADLLDHHDPIHHTTHRQTASLFARACAIIAAVRTVFRSPRVARMLAAATNLIFVRDSVCVCGC